MIIGGYVYRGPVAAFQGHYIFADAGSQNIWKIDPDAVDIPASVTRINGSLTPDLGGIGSLSSFAEDAVGNLYLLELFSGEIFKVTTASLQSEWNGNNAAAGTAGDGVSWGSANNWTRGGVPDVSFVAQDDVVLAAGSSQSTIDLGQDRTVAALTFQSSYTLQNDTLQVLSGNITVAGGVTGTIASSLEAETANHALRKLGPGELLVEGQSGQIVVKEGTLGGSGNFDYLTVDDGGTFSPGASPGIATVTEDFRLREGGTLRIDIGGTDANPADPEFDRLVVGGEAFLQGDLLVELVNLGGGTYVPGEGDQFAFLEAAGGIEQSLDNLFLPALAPLLEWELSIVDSTATLLVEQVLAGDYNRDDVVDLLDFVVWRDSLGSAVPLGEGADGDANGMINQIDYAIWREHLGEIDSSAAGQAASVPEPASVLLLLLSSLTLAGRNRFHRDQGSPSRKR